MTLYVFIGLVKGKITRLESCLGVFCVHRVLMLGMLRQPGPNLGPMPYAVSKLKELLVDKCVKPLAYFTGASGIVASRTNQVSIHFLWIIFNLLVRMS